MNRFHSEHEEYIATRTRHWDSLARRKQSVLTRQYRKRLSEVYRHIAGECGSILEIGCGNGDLLHTLDPRRGVGVDISREMIQEAQEGYPRFEFVCSDAGAFDIGDETFDVIILSDLLNDLWDVQTIMRHIAKYCDRNTRIVCNVQSHVWEMVRNFAQKLNWVTPTLKQNWLTSIDIYNLAELAGFEIIRRWEEVLCPFPIPIISGFFNKVLVKLPMARLAAMTNFYVMRRVDRTNERKSSYSVSVVVAARNESGHIEELIRRIPEIGSHTEIIFVEGNSTDDTYEVIEREVANSDRDCKVLKQPGKGKGDAVRAGFSVARGDILMILDADMTVPPEDLTRFYDIIASGRGEFINGVRLVYPMENEAMRFFNLMGNKFFSWTFSWLLGQPIRDTLCGTKVISAANYRKIADGRSYFGDFDPFGDFDLLFGAARNNLKIMEIPIRYRARRYGETNIERWAHGWLLLKMVVFAARRLKFR